MKVAVRHGGASTRRVAVSAKKFPKMFTDTQRRFRLGCLYICEKIAVPFMIPIEIRVATMSSV